MIILKTQIPNLRNVVQMTEDSEILSVAFENGIPTIWFRHNTSAGSVERIVWVVETGQEIYRSRPMRLIGRIEHGGLVFHVFEESP